MKGKLTTNLSLTANTSIPRVVHEGGASTWNEITGKPFSRVDTENGLTIQDDTLMIDTLDHIATIDYVDQQIADIDLSDYATKSELDAVEAEIPSLTGYATEQYVDTAISSIPDPTWNDIQNKPTFATVATSGDYDDLSNKPTIPVVPTNVSDFTNDAGYITDSALVGYATEQYVDDAISNIPDPDWSDVQNKPTFATVATSGSYNDLSNTPTIPQPTNVTVTQTLSTGTAIADIDVDGVTTTLYAPAGGGSTQADWTETDSTADSYIQNKPAVSKGTRDNSLIFNHNGNQATALYSTAFGNNNKARGSNSFVVGAYNDTDSPFCVVEGIYNTQVGAYGHAQGQYKYNWPWRNAALLETDVADSIGNGTSNSNRSCAEATTWTGDKFLAGDIYVKVTNWADPRSNSIKLANIPAPPTTDGNYTLQVTVTNGEPSYSWI